MYDSGVRWCVRLLVHTQNGCDVVTHLTTSPVKSDICQIETPEASACLHTPASSFLQKNYHKHQIKTELKAEFQLHV